MTRCSNCGLASTYHRKIGGINEEVVCRSCGNVKYIFSPEYREKELIRIKKSLGSLENPLFKAIEGFIVCISVIGAFMSIPLIFLYMMKSSDLHYIIYGILFIGACFGIFNFFLVNITNKIEIKKLHKEIYGVN